GSPLRPLGSARYLGSTLAFGLAFAAMMAYISASPFVFQTMVGLTTVQYGLLFGFNALVLAATSAASARLTATRSVDGVLGAGLAILLGASLTLLAVVLLGAAPGWVIPPIVVAVGSLGLILGNATALALSAVPRAAGIGSAVLGALQFALAAAVAPLVSLGGQHTAVPLAVVMTVTAALAMTSHLVTRGR
ncbi:MAG: multidrug effflux MFS transporter, partial [Cellulomonadaceae bacterium]|nr:multidrug effflux MFS transporter [Cellulomonadaceae bacterium]